MAPPVATLWTNHHGKWQRRQNLVSFCETLRCVWSACAGGESGPLTGWERMTDSFVWTSGVLRRRDSCTLLWITSAMARRRGLLVSGGFPQGISSNSLLWSTCTIEPIYRCFRRSESVCLQNAYVNPVESIGKGKVSMIPTSRFHLRVQLNVPLGIFYQS